MVSPYPSSGRIYILPHLKDTVARCSSSTTTTTAGGYAAHTTIMTMVVSGTCGMELVEEEGLACMVGTHH